MKREISTKHLKNTTADFSFLTESISHSKKAKVFCLDVWNKQRWGKWAQLASCYLFIYFKNSLVNCRKLTLLLCHFNFESLILHINDFPVMGNFWLLCLLACVFFYSCILASFLLCCHLAAVFRHKCPRKYWTTWQRLISLAHKSARLHSGTAMLWAECWRCHAKNADVSKG